MMNVRNLILAGLVIVFCFGLTGVIRAEDPSELLAIPEFAAAAPEARLDWINQKLDSGEFASRNISGDVMARFIMDVLVAEESPEAQMKKYGQIRQKYGKLVSTYDLEKYLAMRYLATSEEAKKADLKGKVKLIHQLQKQNVLSWPGIADVLKGMLAAHLATSEEFQAMTPLQQIEYLSSMDGLNIVSNLTSSSYTKGVASEWMSRTPADQQEEVFTKIYSSADFFTRSTVKKGYVD